MKKPHASVRYSVINPGAMSPPDSSGILAAAMDRMEPGALRLQRGLDGAEELLRLCRVVVREIAHVDIDGDKPVLRPGVNRKMRLGQQHRPRDALRSELMER